MTSSRTYGREMIRGWRHALREKKQGHLIPAPLRLRQPVARYTAFLLGWHVGYKTTLGRSTCKQCGEALDPDFAWPCGDDLYHPDCHNEMADEAAAREERNS